LVDWLEQAIEKTGITKFQLASDSGVSRALIYRILEGDISASWENVQRLANALKVDQPRLARSGIAEETPESRLKEAIAQTDRVTRLVKALREALSKELIRRTHQRKKRAASGGRKRKRGLRTDAARLRSV
jgi:transcriptional regulator with XRE-family HTH domain